MSEQQTEWEPLTKWNVGRIGSKQLVSFQNGFSTCAAHAQYCSRIEQDRAALVAAERRAATERRRRPTVEQLIARYNI